MSDNTDSVPDEAVTYTLVCAYLPDNKARGVSFPDNARHAETYCVRKEDIPAMLIKLADWLGKEIPQNQGYHFEDIEVMQ